MKRMLGIVIGGVLLSAGGVHAAPGDCFNGGTVSSDCAPANCPGANPTTCSGDDSGCVSNTKSHRRCAAIIGKAFGVAVQAVITCHIKQAVARFKGADAATADSTEDTCEVGPNGGNSAREKLDATLLKLQNAGICDAQQLVNAAAEESLLMGHPSPIPSLSIDGQNGGVYCDSSMGAEFIANKECEGGSNDQGDCNTDADCPGGQCLREDTGWVPKDKGSLKCENTLAREIGKLVSATIACHAKMDAAFFKGKQYDEESCEETNLRGNGAHDKFDKVRDKIVGLGICPPCNDTAGWDGQAANAIGTVDGANVIAYPCNLGS